MTAASLAILLLPPVFAHPPEFHRLDSGLRIVIVEDHAVPAVSVQLWYAVGGADDPDDLPGLTEVCRRRLAAHPETGPPAPGLVSRTLRDACCFACVVPPDRLEDVLHVEATRLARAAAGNLPSADAEARPPDGQDMATDRVLAELLPNHPSGRRPDHVSSAAAAADDNTLTEFAQRWFVPGNATLFIIGDVQPVRVLEAARRLLGTLPWAEAPRRPRGDWPPAETVRRPTSNSDAGVSLAWLAPEASSPDGAAVNVLLHRLCNPVDGTLCLRLAERGGPPPVWRRGTWRHGGLVVLDVPAGGRITADEAADLVLDTLRRAAETLPDTTSFQRARALAARDIRQTRADFGTRALRLAWHEMVGGDLLRAEHELPRVERLPVSDMQRAARLLLDARTAILPGCLGAGDEGALTISAEPAAPTAAATELKLPGGARVRIITQPGTETARVRTLVAGPPALGAAVGAVVRTGSTDWTIDHFRDYLTYRGLDLFPLADDEAIGLASSGPAALVAQMIELHAKLLRTPNRDPAACERAAAQAAALRAALATLPHDEAGRTYVPPGAIGWHATWPVTATPVELRAALDALDAIQGVNVIVESPLEPAAVQAAAEEYWGDWAPPASQPSPPARPGL